jgi:acyl-CoA reductase-like NAD-dependent aldehyde dehydrogenase
MSNRLGVLKTYKIFIGGKFTRTESGRFFQLKVNDQPIANICLSSRKDLRNAVVAARKAFSEWSLASAYNRSQILYRMAEMMESRKAQFIDELILQGMDEKTANKEINTSIDRVIYFAGWADKLNQVFGSVNPVSSSHFNFSLLEPMGVVGVLVPRTPGLLGLVTTICQVIISGNTCVVIASDLFPLSAITLAEVIATSDFPNGVVNILTGLKNEIALELAKHMDVNALYFNDANKDFTKSVQMQAVNNLKRIILPENFNWHEDSCENPYAIIQFMEIKTTWHPIENISEIGSRY